MCRAQEGAKRVKLPLPLWERVGVRGSRSDEGRAERRPGASFTVQRNAPGDRPLICVCALKVGELKARFDKLNKNVNFKLNLPLGLPNITAAAAAALAAQAKADAKA